MIQDLERPAGGPVLRFEPFGNFARYSEDHGKTWYRSAPGARSRRG